MPYLYSGTRVVSNHSPRFDVMMGLGRERVTPLGTEELGFLPEHHPPPPPAADLARGQDLVPCKATGTWHRVVGAKETKTDTNLVSPSPITSISCKGWVRGRGLNNAQPGYA